MVEQFANSEDSDQTPRFAASDLGLYCLLFANYCLEVSNFQWVKQVHLTVWWCPNQKVHE